VADALLAEALILLGDVAAASTLLAGRLDRRGTIAEQFDMHARLSLVVAREDWQALPDELRQAREREPWEKLYAPAADRAEGRMLALTGRREEGALLLRRAAAAFERYELPFELARTREWHADAAGDAGERRYLLRAALSSYEQLSADLHTERVTAALARQDQGQPA
jgi:hypothetical protein